MRLPPFLHHYFLDGTLSLQFQPPHYSGRWRAGEGRPAVTNPSTVLPDSPCQFPGHSFRKQSPLPLIAAVSAGNIVSSVASAFPLIHVLLLSGKTHHHWTKEDFPYFQYDYQLKHLSNYFYGFGVSKLLFLENEQVEVGVFIALDRCVCVCQHCSKGSSWMH